MKITFLDIFLVFLGISGYFWVFYYLGEIMVFLGYFIIAAWVFFNYGERLPACLPAIEWFLRQTRKHVSQSLGHLFRCIIVCEDFNCPSTNNNRVSFRLEDSLISADHEQRDHEPTRRGNLLDIFATSDPNLVSSVLIVDSCSVSDQKLVIAAINVDPVTVAYQNINFHTENIGWILFLY